MPDRPLAAVAGLDEPSLDTALHEAIEHRLLVVDEADDGYVFRHALTRDAIYGDTLPRERVRIHAAYADALSTDPGFAGADAEATVATALALHWSAAHDLPRALPACLDAARLAAPYAPAEALRQLEGSSDARYQWPLVWLGLRIEAKASQPAPERVTVLRALAGELAAETSPARVYRALAAAEAGEPAEWTRAAAVCREASDPYLLAYALVRQAQSLCAAGARADAAGALREAARLAMSLGAEPLLGEARALARRARIQVDDDGALPDAFGLTEREREVLVLLSEGRSNPQIASALFISPKTASVHVSNILGTLSVASRGEAAAIAHRHGLT